MQALVLDCGGVIARPVHGQWGFPPEMDDLLRPFSVQDVAMAKLRAIDWLDESLQLDSLEEENLQRMGFLRAVTNDLGIYVENETLTELARRVTYAPELYAIYSDVRVCLTSWKQHYKLGLLSNAMPSMKVAMEHHGVLELFDVAIASCDIGAVKPAPQMYQAILDQLGVPAEQTFFVDDLPENLRAARTIGMRPILMARSEYLKGAFNTQPWDGESVTSLAELDQLL